jgi:tetratricopeptide (TPR) repeat protein
LVCLLAISFFVIRAALPTLRDGSKRIEDDIARKKEIEEARKLGEWALEHKDYTLAVKAFSEVLEKSDRKEIRALTLTYTQRGFAYYHLDEFAKARDDLTKAIQLMPGEPGLYEMRSRYLDALAGKAKRMGKKAEEEDYRSQAEADIDRAKELGAKKGKTD